MFLESSEETATPTVLRRWLRNYGSQGILQRLAGLLVGRPGNEIPESDFQQHDAAVMQVIRDELGLRTLPVVTRMDFGHTDPVFILPYGVRVALDCQNRSLAINEGAVV